MSLSTGSIALSAIAGSSLAASYGVWRRYVLLGHPGFKFRMSRAARALLDVAVLTAASVGTAALALSQPRLLLTVISTLLSPAARYGVRYGSHPRQTLDIHSAMSGGTAAAALLHPLPAQRSDTSPSSMQRPLVVFVHGGAWAFGESWQYAAVCRKTAQLGVVAASVSYRLYPHGDAQDMADDVILALQYLILNAQQLGIDPARITLVGHSAGAHLVCMAQLRLATAAAGQNTAAMGTAASTASWFAADRIPPRGSVHAPVPVSAEMARRILRGITGAILKSGVYDIARHYEWESRRSMADVSWLGPMDPACGGPTGANAHSPALQLADMPPAAVALLPPQVVYHSPWDETVPFDTAVQLGHALARAGAPRFHLVTPTHGHFEGHGDVMIALMGGNPDAKHSPTYGAELSKAYLRLISQVMAGEVPAGTVQPLPQHQRIHSEARLMGMRKTGHSMLAADAKL